MIGNDKCISQGKHLSMNDETSAAVVQTIVKEDIFLRSETNHEDCHRFIDKLLSCNYIMLKK